MRHDRSSGAGRFGARCAVLVGIVSTAISTAHGSGLIGLAEGSVAARRGVLEVRVKDHRDAIGDFARLDVILDTIRIRPRASSNIGRGDWRDLNLSQQKIDLTKYSGQRSARVFRGEIAPGSFDAIHLKLKKIEGMRKGTMKTALVRDRVGPIRLAFTIKSHELTLIVLDLAVIDLSDHPAQGYELYLKGYELYLNGKLTERVPPG